MVWRLVWLYNGIFYLVKAYLQTFAISSIANMTRQLPLLVSLSEHPTVPIRTTAHPDPPPPMHSKDGIFSPQHSSLIHQSHRTGYKVFRICKGSRQWEKFKAKQGMLSRDRAISSTHCDRLCYGSLWAVSHHSCRLGKEGVGADCRGSYHCPCWNVVGHGYSVELYAEILQQLVRCFNVCSVTRHEEKVHEKISTED